MKKFILASVVLLTLASVSMADVFVGIGFRRSRRVAVPVAAYVEPAVTTYAYSSTYYVEPAPVVTYEYTAPAVTVAPAPVYVAPSVVVPRRRMYYYYVP